MKKILSVSLALALLLSVFAVIPFTASAVDADVAAIAQSGTTGDCTWTLDGTELTISGEGEMGDYGYEYDWYKDTAPWGTDITKVTIENGVTNIGSNAFEDCTKLTSIAIPDSVTKIGSNAFYCCTGLTSITIPDSVTSIGDYAFYECTGLTSVIIPDAVTEICDFSFYGCSGLTELSLGKSATDLSKYAFSECSGLESISVDPENAKYDSRNNCNAIIETEANTLFCGCMNTVIPNSVTKIGDNAFKDCTGLTSIVIPDSVTSIGGYAFWNCTSLTCVTIPFTVTELEYGSFGYYYYRSETDERWREERVDGFTINGYTGSTAEEYAEKNGFTFVSLGKMPPRTGTTGACTWTLDGTELTISGNGAMGSYSYADWGTDITKATIENGVTSIGCSAFKDCAGLTSVTIPASVTSISNWAFEGCTGLTSITVPGSVTSIGYVALGYYYDYNIGDFRRINSFTIRGYTGSTAEEYAEENGIAFVSIGKMPPRTGTTGDCTWTLDGTELTISGKGAMDDYYNDSKPWGTKITKVTIKNGVTSIGDYAFFDCDMLTSISIPDSVEHIGRYALHNTAWYDSMPDGIVYAGKVAYCLKGGSTGKLTIKAGTVSITPGAFNWAGVTSVTIPDSVKEIGYRAFYNCVDLKELTLGSGVSTIGYWAFYNCKSLKSVTIPESVTGIGSQAFGFYYNPVRYTDFARVDDFTVYGKPGSAAEQYAKDNGFTFKSFTKPIQFATPKVTKVQNTVNGVSFAWSKSEGAAKYRVFRKAGSGSFAKLADTTALTYVDQTAKSGTTYTYTVRCISADGKTYTSDYDKTGKSILYIAQPKITKLENTANGVSITLGKVNGAAKYRVFRKAGTGSFAKLVDTAALTYVDKTAKSGTKYAYTVRCISKDGKSYTSSYDTVGKSILYLAQPKITKFENVANGIKLTLSKSTGAASYKVFLKSGKAWKQLATVKTNTYTYAKAKSGTTYAFTVRAVSKDGKTLSAYNTTGWKQKFVTSPALPTLKNTKNGVQVTLKKVAGAEKYRIFRKVGNGKFAKLADTTSLKYVDKTAKNGKTYYYTICCISKNGKTITSAYNTKGKVIKCKR